MAETVVSPGVFTNEYDGSFLPSAIGKIGAAIIGPTAKGQAFVPTIVTSYEDFMCCAACPNEKRRKVVPLFAEL